MPCTGMKRMTLAVLLAATLPAAAHTVRGGLWEEQVLSGGAPEPAWNEETWRKMSEEMRLHGRRPGRGGQHAQVCWVEHKLSDYDAEFRELMPDAVVTYSDLKDDAFTLSVKWKLGDTLAGETVTRFRWLGTDCGDLVAQAPGRQVRTAQAAPTASTSTAAADAGVTGSTIRPGTAAPTAAPPVAAATQQGFDAQHAWKEVNAARKRNDWDLARTFLLALAERGDRDAMFGLGQMYHKGAGVAVDMSETVRWYDRAAQAGHPEAQLAVGMAHLQGVGVEKNPELGRQWLEKAAQQNVPLAQDVLARGPEAALASHAERGEQERVRSEAQRRRAQAEEAYRQAQAEYQRQQTAYENVRKALDRVTERVLKLADAVGKGQVVSLVEVENSQRELQRLEPLRRQTSQRANEARQRMHEMRERLEKIAAEEKTAQKAAQTTGTQGAKPAPAAERKTASTSTAPAKPDASGSGKRYYAVGAIYEKRGKTVCSDSRLVLNGEVRSPKNEGSLTGELRSQLRSQYPNSANNSYLVSVVPEGQAMIVYQVERLAASQPCKDNHIEVARGKTMAEAEAKLNKLPRSTRFVREIQRWPVGLER